MRLVGPVGVGMTDSTKSPGSIRPMGANHVGNSTTDVEALMPDSPSLGLTYLTLLLGLFSVGIGITLFAFGDAPTGSPVPVLSVVFIVVGVLFWFAAEIERQTVSPETTL